MKFEAKPFDNYGSITLDELKDQTNSLLNLVTEELRPLTVTMKNGKKFLLFSRELLDPIYDQDLCVILLSAMRYSMGKRTYIPQVVVDYIRRYIRLLDDKFLTLDINDIRHHLEDYREHDPNLNLWQGLLTTLKARQNGKTTHAEKAGRPCPACGMPLEIMNVADNQRRPGGFDVIAHCENCLSDYEWFRDKDSNDSEMKRYFFG